MILIMLIMLIMLIKISITTHHFSIAKSLILVSYFINNLWHYYSSVTDIFSLEYVYSFGMQGSSENRQWTDNIYNFMVGPQK